MRASTLGILAIAVLVGLGATAGAKYAGLFDSVVPPVVKEEPIMVLAAKNNLFIGHMVTENDVVLREVTAEEKRQYESMKDKLPPPQRRWANYRLPARNISVNELLLAEDFQDLEMAKGVAGRLGTGMKAIQLILTPEHASGGLLRVNDYVDVVITSTVSVPGSKSDESVTRTAVIARDVKIIVKRNNLNPVLAPPVGADKLVNYTLEVNPYRAALIEYARTRGTISVQPSSVNTQRPVLKPGAKPTFSDPTSMEYKDEDLRIAALERGELTVGDNDLMRIFKIVPAPPEPLPPPPTEIEIINGVGKGGVRRFANTTGGAYETSEPPLAGSNGNGGGGPNGNYASPRSGGVKFIPAQKDCPTCGKKKT